MKIRCARTNHNYLMNVSEAICHERKKIPSHHWSPVTIRYLFFQSPMVVPIASRILYIYFNIVFIYLNNSNNSLITSLCKTDAVALIA